MKKITSLFIELVITATLVITGAMAFSLTAADGHASAASAATVEECKHNFLGLKPWYQYIGNELDDGTPKNNSPEAKEEAKRNKCNVKCFNVFTQGKDADGNQQTNECGQSSSDIPLVLLAIVDDLIRIAALISLGFVIVGAFKYVGSQGNPDSTAKAQETIVNALLGLAIAVSAVAIVSFVGNKIGS